MFSKQHYEYFATLLANAKTVRELEESLIDKFSQDNDSFDALRFREAIAQRRVVEDIEEFERKTYAGKRLTDWGAHVLRGAMA